MPGLADYLGKVGPKYIYLKAEAFWDFILLLLLFYYMIKKAFHTVRGVQESGLGILQGAARALTGETRESKTIDNVIAFIIALVFTFGVTAYTKVSLKFLFVKTRVSSD